jgi:ATP/ADP translocase
VRANRFSSQVCRLGNEAVNKLPLTSIWLYALACRYNRLRPVYEVFMVKIIQLSSSIFFLKIRFVLPMCQVVCQIVIHAGFGG